MKVGVLMFYDENVKSYADINYFINKQYCAKYNLELIVSNTHSYSNRHPAWERLPFLLNNILNYDYLIWIDADAFFYNDVNNICDIITQHADYNFIFSNDIGDNNINTGIFIVKNNQYSIDFLTKWAYDEELYNNNPYPAWWDQGVLIDMYNKNILQIQTNSIRLSYGILQHFDEHELNTFPNKPYVYHLAGKDAGVRYAVSNQYLYKNYYLCTFMENRKYSWENHYIIFLANYQMDAFGEGTYTQEGTHTFQANFGYQTHTIEFNNDYTQFTSTRHSDGCIVTGFLL